MTDTARKEAEAYADKMVEEPGIGRWFDRVYAFEAGRAAGRAVGWKERGEADYETVRNLLYAQKRIRALDAQKGTENGN